MDPLLLLLLLLFLFLTLNSGLDGWMNSEGQSRIFSKKNGTEYTYVCQLCREGATVYSKICAFDMQKKDCGRG